LLKKTKANLIGVIGEEVKDLVKKVNKEDKHKKRNGIWNEIDVFKFFE